MVKSLFILIGVFLISSNSLIAQNKQEQSLTDSTSRSFHIISGYNYSSSHIVELGMSFRNSKTSGYHMFESNLALSSEVVLGKNLIIGPKISGWIAGGSPPVAIGLSILNYTDLKQNEFNIRPEIGVGILGVKAVYGYNIKILGAGFDEISKSSFSLIFPLFSKER